MEASRERKRDPHRCAACEAAFEVLYFDDRGGERALLPPVTVDVACPQCGKKQGVALPAGSERTLLVELDLIGEADEGEGG
jgi:hypothetical protein